MGVKIGYAAMHNGTEATLRCDKCGVKIYKFLMPDGGILTGGWSEFNETCVCGNELFRIIDGKKIPLITGGTFDMPAVAKPPEDELKLKVDDLYDLWDGGDCE